MAPYHAISFSGPKMVQYPPLALSLTQAHLCDTPFHYMLRDNCAMPHKNKRERVLQYYRHKYFSYRCWASKEEAEGNLNILKWGTGRRSTVSSREEAGSGTSARAQPVVIPSFKLPELGHAHASRFSLGKLSRPKWRRVGC